MSHITVNELIEKLVRASEEFGCGDDEVWMCIHRELANNHFDVSTPLTGVVIHEKDMANQKKVIQLLCE